MARSNHSHVQQPEMDHIQPKNVPHNESLPLGQKLLAHHRSDAPLRIGHSGHGNMAVRSNDLPPSSRVVQTLGYRVGDPGTSHASFAHGPTGSSSSHLAEPTVSYTHRPEEGFAPVGSHMDNRRAAMKRKNPLVNPVGISANGYYVGSSSNTQLSNSVQPNPSSLAEPFLPPMPLSIGLSGWNGQHLIHQEGFQRNVRARHNHNISLEPGPALTYIANTIHLPSFGSAASASVGTSGERNQAPVSVPTRTMPSGAPGLTSSSLERPYYPAIGSSNSSVGAVPTVPSSGRATFANGGYASRTVHGGNVPTYPHPASAAPSGSRAMPHDTIIRSYPPATSTAAASTSMWMQPLPATTAASSRHARLVSVGHASNGRNRRARSSYYGFHPLMLEAERFMMLDQLVFYESRSAAADPHRDMRLDIDNMGYEDLLALGEFMGNVNTGLAEEKISVCVREVVCCSSDQTPNNQDDGSCVICLEDYKDKDLLGTLKCNHDFHAECIKKWLQTKNSCPVCKAAAA